MSISAGYVFSRGLRLPMFVDTNLAPATTTRTYDVTNLDRRHRKARFTVPFYTARIDPTGPVLTGYSDVNSWYNSMVRHTAARRMSTALEFTANYTLSKGHGWRPGSRPVRNVQWNGFRPSIRRTASWNTRSSDLDQRHRFVGNVIWAPTYARKISNTAARLILDGFNLLDHRDRCSTASRHSHHQRRRFGRTGRRRHRRSGEQFRHALSSARFPGVPAMRSTGPGLANVDLRIGREFTLRERMKLSFVGEAFNLFNFTNIFTVNTTRYNFTAAGSGLAQVIPMPAS